jgi:Cof subfamily protein (haloacid dehalogenase superfamily)
MPKYQWCVCDMDGTLLNSSDNISDENEAALKKLQKNGIEVIIATGRLDLMVKRYIEQLDLQGHIISCNGGLIRNIHTGEIIYSNVMDKEVVKELLTHSFKEKIDFLVYTPYVMFSNRNNPRAVRYESINNTVIADISFEVKYIDSDDMTVMEGMDILKVLLIFPTQEQVEEHITMCSKHKSLYAVSSAQGLLDIMAAGSSKGKAVKLLADRCGVDLSDIIAFGDNHNDIEMLSCAGMAVAMGNSVDELKAVAQFVTKSNDESGIAYAIDHLYEEGQL